MKKRFICILVSLCMVLTLLPSTALAAQEGGTGVEATQEGGARSEDADLVPTPIPTATPTPIATPIPKAEGVARIEDTGYSTLTAAVDAVTEGQTIRLMKDIRENIWSKVNCSYTIDLNGKTLGAVGGENALRKYGSGTLTITDTVGGGKITSATLYGTIFVSKSSIGKVVISGGTIENTLASPALSILTGDVDVTGGVLTSAGQVIQKQGSGNLSISGGTVSSTSTYKPSKAIIIIEGSMNISGGTVSSTLGWAIDSTRSDIKISGGTVSGGSGAIEANLHSSVSVSGGTVSGGEYAIYLVGGVLDITGGTMYVSGTKAKSALYIYKCGDLDINITGGIVDGGNGFGISGHTGSLGIADTIQSGGVVIKGGQRAVGGTVKFDDFRVKATASLRADGTSPQPYSKGSATLYRYLKFEPNPIKDAVITITKEPTPLTTLTKGKISGSLSAAASINVTDKVQLKYQWYYSKDNNEPKALPGATSATYSFPSTLTAATHYYYCVVTANGGVSVRTQVAKVVVVDQNAAKSAITIKKQPTATTNVIQGKISGSLTVSASVTNNKQLTYQWAVSNSGPSREIAVEIAGATKMTFDIPKNLTEGDYYYFCIIRSVGMEPIMTTVAKVTVKDVAKRIVLADTSGQSFLERKEEIISYYKELNAMSKSLGTNKYLVSPVLKAPYASGALTPAYLAYTTKTLNFVRFLSGLPDDIKTTDELNQLSQEGALLLNVGTYSHTPAQPKDMSKELYDKGYKSTSSSNIAQGFTGLYTTLVSGWMADDDEGNISRVGHRRWALNPGMQYTGFGDVGKSYTMYAHDKSRAASVDYYAVGYPSGAAFPSDIFLKSYPWSVSLNPLYYETPNKDSVKVSLTGEGKSYEFSSRNSSFAGNYFNVNEERMGTGSCIIFRPSKDSAYNGEYTVRITGLKTKGGEDTSLSYTVNFFALNDDAKPDTDKKQPAKPTTEPTKKPTKLKAGVNILSYPKRTVYTLGDGFDPAGLKAVNYVGGKQTSINSKITFYTSKTVQLTKGRPFTTTGKKVVEVRYNGKKVATYTIYVNGKKK
jgi:hypothetical protein